MTRVLLFVFVLFSLVGCSQPPAPGGNTNAQASPSAAPASVSGAAASPAPASSIPAPMMSPIAPDAKAGGKPAKDQKPLPPALWERMTRPLTLEEINQLPPETRDMILRAQGRLPASPAPKKK